MSDPSDPNLEPTPAVPVEPEVPEAPEPEPVEPAEPQPEPAAKPENGIEKRFSSYAQRLRQADAIIARYERMFELTQGAAARTTAPEPPPAAPDPLPPRPRRENYADPDAFDDAMIEWQDKRYARQRAIERAEDDQHRKALTEQQQREAAQREAQAEFERRENVWVEKMAKAEAEEPEWFDAFEAVGVGLPPAMADAIRRADDGVALVMHLFKNPEVKQRIAGLSDPATMLYEMGKLEARIGRPEPVVRAPTTPPMRPVGRGSAGTPTRDIYAVGNEPGNKDYFSMRQEQIAAANRARH